MSSSQTRWNNLNKRRRFAADPTHFSRRNMKKYKALLAKMGMELKPSQRSR